MSDEKRSIEDVFRDMDLRNIGYLLTNPSAFEDVPTERIPELIKRAVDLIARRGEEGDTE